MTKTNFLLNIGNISFSISPEADDFLTAILCNEIELLNITGGIPEQSIDIIHHVIDYNTDTTSLIFSTQSKWFVAERELFWNDKLIDNKYLEVFSTGRRIGTFIFINEVIQARKLGIVSLKVSAAKSDRLNGYYTWARLGYSIDSPDDQEGFDRLMKDYGRQEQSMIELMRTKEGRKFWQDYGFWWQGAFDLLPNSENIAALNAYLAETGINLSL